MDIRFHQDGRHNQQEAADHLKRAAALGILYVDPGSILTL
jgi:hypothetical protein